MLTNTELICLEKAIVNMAEDSFLWKCNMNGMK